MTSITDYRNGEIPLHLLELLGSGTNEDGYWEHRAPAGTAAKIRRLQQLVLERTGIVLRVTPGWNIYRPIGPQGDAKRKYGNNAAAPGHSSHGGWFSGRFVCAVDFANGAEVGWDLLFELAREVGLTPLVFDWEPWHFVDYAPHTIPSWAIAPKPKPKPTPANESEEDDMHKTRIIHMVDKNGKPNEWCLIGATVPAVPGQPETYGARSTKSQDTANAWAIVHGSSSLVNKKEWDRRIIEHRALARDYNAQQVANLTAAFKAARA